MSFRTWETKRILVTVKSYPRPSKTHGETVCIAGITDDGEWIRLYPVTYRDLPREQQFGKWDWIEARVAKSRRDHRQESYVADPLTIRKVGHVGTDKSWEQRRYLLLPHVDRSLEALKLGTRSLGLIKPASVTDFLMDRDTKDWDPDKKRHLAQQTLFNQRMGVLEKVPFTFKYKFTCHDEGCQGHTSTIVDWEVFQAYRKWRREYGSNVHQVMRQKFLEDLAQHKDLYFFVGTALAQDHYRVFLIVGLFYPPVVDSPHVQQRLFV